jgi:hypothetical protein
VLERFTSWFRRRFQPSSETATLNGATPPAGSTHGRYAVRVEADPPESPTPGVLHLARDGQGSYWLAVLRCPCGCGEAIELPMSQGSRPCWHFRGTAQEPSLWPSVRRSRGCRSHFILSRGRIRWCKDDPF